MPANLSWMLSVPAPSSRLEPLRCVAPRGSRGAAARAGVLPTPLGLRLRLCRLGGLSPPPLLL
eukprot:1412311-Prymnesium_polylepis.1